MSTIEDARDMALALPEVDEVLRYGHRAWRVRGAVFAWHRPFSKADIKRFGDETPPTGDILAITTEDLGDKEAVLAAHPGSFFSIQHLDNYPAVLVQLSAVGPGELREALLDGWLAAAPPDLADRHLGRREG
jgi:hypothetical protein